MSESVNQYGGSKQRLEDETCGLKERFACEGCGQTVDELIEDEGMNLLCKPCAALPDEDL